MASLDIKPTTTTTTRFGYLLTFDGDPFAQCAAVHPVKTFSAFLSERLFHGLENIFVLRVSNPGMVGDHL